MSTSFVSPTVVFELLVLAGDALAFCAKSDRWRCRLSFRRGMKRSGRHAIELELRLGENGLELLGVPGAIATAGLSGLSSRPSAPIAAMMAVPHSGCVGEVECKNGGRAWGKVAVAKVVSAGYRWRVATKETKITPRRSFSGICLPSRELNVNFV